MADTVPVKINVDGPNTLSLPDEATVEGDLLVQVENQGTDAHVHIRLDDTLSEIAALPESNHYVEGGESLEVPISFHPDTAATGVLEVVTGYGAHQQGVTLHVDTSPDPTVTVDDSLDTPSSRTRTAERSTDTRRVLPLGLIGAFCVIAAVIIGATSEIGALLVGVGAVVAGVAAALYFLAQS